MSFLTVFSGSRDSGTQNGGALLVPGTATFVLLESSHPISTVTLHGPRKHLQFSALAATKRWACGFTGPLISLGGLCRPPSKAHSETKCWLHLLQHSYLVFHWGPIPMPHKKPHPVWGRGMVGTGLGPLVICGAAKITLGYLFPGVPEWTKSHHTTPAF